MPTILLPLKPAVIHSPVLVKSVLVSIFLTEGEGSPRKPHDPCPHLFSNRPPYRRSSK